jgi:hypothetical protein
MGWANDPEALRHVLEPIRTMPGVADLLTPAIRDVVRAHYRTPFRVVHVRVWRTAWQPPQEAALDVYGNLWHNDTHPVSTLKVFVQLSPGVTKDRGGALRLHPADSTRDIMRAGYVRQRIVSKRARARMEDPDRVVVFDGVPGSVLFCNTQRCLHRAGMPEPDAPRGMIQFAFLPSRTELPDDWADHLPPDAAVVGALQVT